MSAGHTSSGRVVLVGRLTLQYRYFAFAVFLDNCGSVKAHVLIAAPGSYSTILKTVSSLPNQRMLLAGSCAYNRRDVALLSTVDPAGHLINSVLLQYSLHITVMDGLAVRSGSEQLLVVF